MMRILVHVEGQTEETFVDTVRRRGFTTPNGLK